MSVDQAMHLLPEASRSRFLSGRRLLVARVAWLLIAFAGVIMFIAGVPLRYRELLTPCAGDNCASAQLSFETIAALQVAGFSAEAYAAVIVGAALLVAVVYVAAGLFIFWRHSHEWVALLGSLWLVTLGVTLLEGEVRALATNYPWTTAPVYALINLGGVILLALFLYIFPNGRFVPRWTRWVYPVVVTLFLAVPIIEVFQPRFFATILPALMPIWGVMVLAGVVAQGYRYARVSSPIERQQTKWIMLGLLSLPLIVVVFILTGLSDAPFGEPALDAAVDNALQQVAGSLIFMIVPVTIGFSILRYRLWDTDNVINRALVYGLLTVILALLYFGSVILLQQLVQALTGQQSSLAVVGSTLLTAALFTPVRRRVQALIDRRFYRRKYDAANTLNEFARVSQGQVDLNQLTSELLHVVQQTMQPDSVSLWLREGLERPAKRPK